MIPKFIWYKSQSRETIIYLFMTSLVDLVLTMWWRLTDIDKYQGNENTTH